MIPEIEVDFSGLTGLERALMANEKNFAFATAQALNDCARAASRAVNAAMPAIFDRPTPFTDRAAIAPRALAATRDSLVATVTLRPTQAQYLALEETGGTRSPQDNTRRQASALVLPGKTLTLDAFGNVPNGTLASFRKLAAADLKVRRGRAAVAKKHKLSIKARQKVEVGPRFSPTRTNTVFYLPANAPANQAGVGGYFRRLNKMQIARLTAFEPDTHYKARLDYHARVTAAFNDAWPEAIQTRLRSAFAAR